MATCAAALCRNCGVLLEIAQKHWRGVKAAGVKMIAAGRARIAADER